MQILRWKRHVLIELEHLLCQIDPVPSLLPCEAAYFTLHEEPPTLKGRFAAVGDFAAARARKSVSSRLCRSTRSGSKCSHRNSWEIFLKPKLNRSWRWNTVMLKTQVSSLDLSSWTGQWRLESLFIRRTFLALFEVHGCFQRSSAKAGQTARLWSMQFVQTTLPTEVSLKWTLAEERFVLCFPKFICSRSLLLTWLRMWTLTCLWGWNVAPKNSKNAWTTSAAK